MVLDTAVAVSCSGDVLYLRQRGWLQMMEKEGENPLENPKALRLMWMPWVKLPHPCPSNKTNLASNVCAANILKILSSVRRSFKVNHIHKNKIKKSIIKSQMLI